LKTSSKLDTVKKRLVEQNWVGATVRRVAPLISSAGGGIKKLWRATSREGGQKGQEFKEFAVGDRDREKGNPEKERKGELWDDSTTRFKTKPLKVCVLSSHRLGLKRSNKSQSLRFSKNSSANVKGWATGKKQKTERQFLYLVLMFPQGGSLKSAEGGRELCSNQRRGIHSMVVMGAVKVGSPFKKFHSNLQVGGIVGKKGGEASLHDPLI